VLQQEKESIEESIQNEEKSIEEMENQHRLMVVEKG